MYNIVLTKQAQTEWGAWQVVVTESKRHGIDFNADPRMHAAITAWAEELVALRKLQDERTVDRAYCEATERFDSVFA